MGKVRSSWAALLYEYTPFLMSSAGYSLLPAPLVPADPWS